MVREKEIHGMPGWLMVFVLSAALIGSIVMLIRSIAHTDSLGVIGWLVLLLVAAYSFFGLTVVNPNLAKVVLVFGDYNRLSVWNKDRFAQKGPEHKLTEEDYRVLSEHGI